MYLTARSIHFIALVFVLVTGVSCSQQAAKKQVNPFLTELNQPADYAKITSDDLQDYAKQTLDEASGLLTAIKQQPSGTFDNIFVAMDEVGTKLYAAAMNSYMLFWLSPDSATRVRGFAAYQLLDSMITGLSSDSVIYQKMTAFRSSAAYPELKENRKILVNDLIDRFERSGVKLSRENLQHYKKLTKEINELSSAFSTNINSANEILTLDEKAAEGIPEEFKNTYKASDGKYNIPVSNSSSDPVLSNAVVEETRKAYQIRFMNIAADKNLPILDSMVKKRDELGKLMGYPSYAAYSLVPKMAKNTETVYSFLDDLIRRSSQKAKNDLLELESEKRKLTKDPHAALQRWDIKFYKNQILKSKYNVDQELVKAYFPMDASLKGMFDLYQELLGLEFKKVKDPSVWHEEVEMYEVYEDGKLKGWFYLDLYPRPNKEAWFYGIPLITGRATAKGYELPAGVLLGNFSRPTKTQPSLLSQWELSTLFHEFGHIMNGIAYHGEFGYQFNPKDDFAEAMSQIFENWLWNYDVLSSVSKHYKTGEKLPKETFDNMLKAKNLGSGFAAIGSVRYSLYDMYLYDKYNAAAPVSTDQIWRDVDKKLSVTIPPVEGTHEQANWVHINTNPVYMYGYLWSSVYAQDMFAVFEKNGLRDSKTGKLYRELILANGSQRDIVKAVEEFIGRPVNSQAYVKSLGLE
jgi:Zn-dependent oligopeptidase